MNWVRIVIALVVGVIIFGGVVGATKFRDIMIARHFANMPKAVISVTIDTVNREQWPTTVPAVGTLRAVQGVNISAEVSGQVRQIEFESGQSVEEGQLLVLLDTSEEQTQLTSARATENLAGITADRARSLVRTSAGTKANLDDAIAQQDIAQANSAEIEARIAKKTIRAPFTGELGVRQVDLGEYVAPGQVMVNIQDLTSIYADFTVSQRQLSLLSVGADLNMTVDAWPGRVFKGKITAIAPLVDVNTGMISIEGRFENPVDSKTGLRPLRPGMLAELEAVQPEMRDVLTVPVSAITYQLSGDTVYVVEPLPEDARESAEKERRRAEKAGGEQLAAWEKKRKAEFMVERKQVELGDRQGDRIIIAKGLREGQSIVTAGQMKLESGSYINVSDTVLKPVDVNAPEIQGGD